MKKKTKQRLVAKQDQVEENLITTNPDQRFANYEIRPNDYKIVDLLGKAKSAYTFRGIMRKLGMHQETLSRSLYRLHELGLIDKSNFGYKINTKKRELPTDNVNNIDTPILLSYLSSNISKQKIIDKIAGKWFKNLRWIGIIIDADRQILQWANEDGTLYISLRILPNYIVIETTANNEKGKSEALIGASSIMQKISELHYDSFTS